MMRMEISKTEFEKHTQNRNLICQEIIGRTFKAEIIRNGNHEEVFIVGIMTFTGETPDFYELSQFDWNTSNDLGGEWNENYNIQEFINGHYNLEDYLDDGLIDEIISEENKEVFHNYYITNLPPASEISMNNPVNMIVEKEFDFTDMEITEDILEKMNWKHFYQPDPNGLGTENIFQFLGKGGN